MQLRTLRDKIEYKKYNLKIIKKKNNKKNKTIREISKEYSKRWVKSNHTHYFWYLHLFILVLISWNLYSCSKFEVLIIFILDDTYNICWFWRSITQHLQESQNNCDSFTYMLNWSFQPFSRDYWPSFLHHSSCVCLFYT